MTAVPTDDEWKKIESGLGASNTGAGAHLRAFGPIYKKLVALSGPDVDKMLDHTAPENAAKARKYAVEAYQTLNKAHSAMAKVKVGPYPGKTPEQKKFYTFINATAKFSESLHNLSVGLTSKANAAAGKKRADGGTYGGPAVR